MIMNLIITIFFFLLLFLLVFYCFYKLKNYLKKLKFKIAQTMITLKVMHKKLALIETKLDQQHALITSRLQDAPISQSGMSRESIEYNYDRAKTLLKHQPTSDKEMLKRYHITDEEFELLTDTLRHDGLARE